jgi:hypothetical protein
MNDILLCVGAAGIFFGAIILRGIFGYLKNKKIALEDIKFDWKKFLSGSVKPVLLTLAIGGLAALIVAFLGLVDASGLDVQGVNQVSIKTLLLGLFIADIGAIGYAMSEALMAFGLSDKQIMQIRQTIIEADIDDETGIAIQLEGDELIAKAINIKQDIGDGKEKTEDEAKEQNGAWPYYRVNISSPDAFVNSVNGKGFDEGFGMQCVAGFKEFQYSLCGSILACAGGGANGYARQRAQLEAMGFTYYNDGKLQNGDWVIWGTGQYGHVAMYYNGQFFGQNQGARDAGIGCPFNLMSLSMNGYLCHYRPNVYKNGTPTPSGKKKVDDAIVNAAIRGDYGNGSVRRTNLAQAGYDPDEVQKAVNARLAGQPSTGGNDTVSYTYKSGDTFGQVILNLGLQTVHGLWGDDGDVAYYTKQLNEQGIHGNIPVGSTITLHRRTN